MKGKEIFSIKNGTSFTIQKYFGGEDLVWVNMNDSTPTFSIDGGWIEHEVPEDTITHIGMYLTKDQIKQLIPKL